MKSVYFREVPGQQTCFYKILSSCKSLALQKGFSLTRSCWVVLTKGRPSLLVGLLLAFYPVIDFEQSLIIQWETVIARELAEKPGFKFGPLKSI